MAGQLKAVEMLFAATDHLLQTGEIQEIGWFSDGTSGYSIGNGETKDAFKQSFSFYPFTVGEVHEIVPHETAKEIMRGVLKAEAEAMKQ